MIIDQSTLKQIQISLVVACCQLLIAVRLVFWCCCKHDGRLTMCNKRMLRSFTENPRDNKVICCMIEQARMDAWTVYDMCVCLMCV